jgi:hypothetical protein
MRAPSAPVVSSEPVAPPEGQTPASGDRQTTNNSGSAGTDSNSTGNSKDDADEKRIRKENGYLRSSFLANARANVNG